MAVEKTANFVLGKRVATQDLSYTDKTGKQQFRRKVQSLI